MGKMNRPATGWQFRRIACHTGCTVQRMGLEGVRLDVQRSYTGVGGFKAFDRLGDIPLILGHGLL